MPTMLLERRHLGGGTILIGDKKVPFWWNEAHHTWVIDTLALGKGEERPDTTYFPELGITSRDIFEFISRVY
jgi:hypothetical protein